MKQEQLIIDYFEGKLNVADKITFEQYLQNDSNFAKEVAFQENVKKAITLNERAALKEKLKSFETKKAVKKPLKMWYVAASLIFFLGGGFWFINQSRNSNNLYAEYYQTYPNVIAPTVRGEAKDDLKANAFFAYDNENYTKSLALFTTIYNASKDDYALFYSGISLIELQKHKEALVVLNKFNLNKDNQFSPLVQWYKALCFLKLNHKDKAIDLLKSLVSYDNSQKEMAKNLLDKLE